VADHFAHQYSSKSPARTGGQLLERFNRGLNPEIEKGPVFGETFKGGLEKSQKLPELYEAVAKMGGAEFLNAGDSAIVRI
jgi:hypothetical protein